MGSLSEEDRNYEKELGNEKNCTVVGILDMDAFEVQIYLNHLYGPTTGREIYLEQPCILLDSTTDRIISVNYLAKNHGISRDDDLNGALEKCPDQINVMRKEKCAKSDKPEGRLLRHSSWAVLDSIKDIRKSNNLKFILEYASNDEFYLDLTEEVNYRMNNNSHVPVTLDHLGENTHLEVRKKQKGEAIGYRFNVVHKSNPPKYWQEARLIYGAIILEEIRENIFNKTNFEASGGVSCNKLLAKLACPLHKPGGMTILPETGLERVGKKIQIEKLPTLGGPTGQILKNVFSKDGKNMTMAELANIPVSQIKRRAGFGQEVSVRIMKLANGISHDEVVEKLMKDSVTVGKSNLRSRKLFFNKEREISNVLFELFEEMIERLVEEKERHHRVAESIRFEFNCFPKGHKSKNPAARGFTLQLEEFNHPENVDEKRVINLAMIEYRKMFIGGDKPNGMIVKINLIVKTFL